MSVNREKWLGNITEALASGVTLDWPMPPPVPGDWAPVKEEDAARMLLDLTHLQLFDESRPICDIHKPCAVRSCPARAFPGEALLVEVLLEMGENEGGIATFLYSTFGIYLFDYSSAPFFSMNGRRKKNLFSAKEAEEYLRLFSALLKAEEGRFLILESEQDLLEYATGEPFEDGALDTLRPHLAPLQLEESKGEESSESPEKSWKFHAATLYGRTLYSAVYEVTASRNVSMTEDTQVKDKLPVYMEHFVGPVRIRKKPEISKQEP